MKLRIKRVAKDGYEVSLSPALPLEKLGQELARFLPVPAVFILGGKLERANLDVGHSVEVDI